MTVRRDHIAANRRQLGGATCVRGGRRVSALWSLAAILLGLLLGGCDDVVYGVGTIYIWNGTEHPVNLTVQGRSEFDKKLRPGRGSTHAPVVAGSYTMHSGSSELEFTVHKDRLTIINMDAAGCFARTDILGMYQEGRPPVRVLELYESATVIEVLDVINVMPDRSMPTEAPRRPYPFQRMSVVPCELIVDEDHAEEKVAPFVRRMR